MAAVTITVLRFYDASLSKTWLYAGKSGESHATRLEKGSENVMGADNQQERLRTVLVSSETTRQAPVKQVKI